MYYLVSICSTFAFSKHRSEEDGGENENGTPDHCLILLLGFIVFLAIPAT